MKYVWIMTIVLMAVNAFRLLLMAGSEDFTSEFKRFLWGSLALFCGALIIEARI